MKDIQIDLYVLCYDNLYINQIDTIHNIIYLAVILEKWAMNESIIISNLYDEVEFACMDQLHASVPLPLREMVWNSIRPRNAIGMFCRPFQMASFKIAIGEQLLLDNAKTSDIIPKWNLSAT